MCDIAKLAQLAAAISDAVSVKYRLAVDDQDSEATLDALARRLQRDDSLGAAEADG